MGWQDGTPVTAAPPAWASGTPLAPQVSDPTDGMSVADKVLAGFGKAFSDSGLGAEQIAAWVGQHIPGVDPASARAWAAQLAQQADERKRLDAPLMKTGPGFAGNLAGQVAQTLAVPVGAPETALGRVLASAGVGAGQGALQPIGQDDSRSWNTALSAGLGAGGQAVGNAIGSLASGAKAATPQAQAAVDLANANGGVVTRGQASQSGFIQRLEKMLASLPGSGRFYANAEAKNQAAALNALHNVTGGDAGALIQAAGAGKNFIVDQPMIDDLRGVGQQFAGLADRDAPNGALKTVEQYVGGSQIANPALQGFSASAKAQAIAQGVPEFIGGTSPKYAVGDVMPMVGPQGDFNNYQALRSLYGKRAWGGGDDADKAAYSAVQDALDNAAMRSLQAQGADPTAIANARLAYAAQKIAQPARIVDGNGNVVGYSPAKLAARVAQVDASQPGMIDRLGPAGQTLRDLAAFGRVATPVKSSGTAEGNIAGKVATLDILKDVLSGQGLGHVAAGATGLLAGPWGVNTVLQGTRNGIPLLRSMPAPVSMTLRQLMSAVPAALPYANASQ